MATKEQMLDRARRDYAEWRNGPGDYQTRFCYELTEAEDRVERLERFVGSGFPGQPDKARQGRLKAQLAVMKAYLEILRQRYDDDQL